MTARLEMWREAQRKALGITKVENVPAISEEQILEMKRKIINRYMGLCALKAIICCLIFGNDLKINYY